jgi:hypothetical protein
MSVSNSGTSLSGASSAGAGTAITFVSVCKSHGVAVTVTGYTGTGSATLGLDVSMDDSNWYALPGNILITGNGTYYMPSPVQGGGAKAPALYVRANLRSVAATISAITVTAICASE